MLEFTNTMFDELMTLCIIGNIIRHHNVVARVTASADARSRHPTTPTPKHFIFNLDNASASNIRRTKTIPAVLFFMSAKTCRR